METVSSVGLIWKAIAHTKSVYYPRVPIGYAISSPYLGHIRPISTGLVRESIIDLLYGPVAYNIHKMMHEKYL